MIDSGTYFLETKLTSIDGNKYLVSTKYTSEDTFETRVRQVDESGMEILFEKLKRENYEEKEEVAYFHGVTIQEVFWGHAEADKEVMLF